MRWPRTLSFDLETELRPSNIPLAGTGLFALEAASAGQLLGLDLPQPDWIRTPEHVGTLPHEERRYAWRLFGDLCFLEPTERRCATDYLNHADDPNILWHLGHYFARRDIAIGDELFVDYRIMNHPDWGAPFEGGPVGLPWREALALSSRQLSELLASAALLQDDVRPPPKVTSGS
ncbi:MAG: SET domain-containing protein [Alphaproteobacteria bacterium]|nr:SET domain-containing protein [Alphaproteobacteria bacterium]